MKEVVREYSPDCIAHGFAVNRYRETSHATTRLIEEKDVFVLLALVKLDEMNGLFQFIDQPNEKETDLPNTKQSSIALDAGDVMIWRGGGAMIFPSGAGGILITVRFS